MKDYIFFKGVSIKTFLLISVIISTILTLYAYFFGYHPLITKQEKALSPIKYIALYIIRFIHFFISFISTKLYPFIVDATIFDDLVFLLFALIAFLSGIYNQDCIFTIMERQLLDPTDTRPSNFTYEPFSMVLLGKETDKKPISHFGKIIGLYILVRVTYKISQSKQTLRYILTHPTF